MTRCSKALCFKAALPRSRLCLKHTRERDSEARSSRSSDYTRSPEDYNTTVFVSTIDHGSLSSSDDSSSSSGGGGGDFGGGGSSGEW